jgi:hypothetical protein
VVETSSLLLDLHPRGYLAFLSKILVVSLAVQVELLLLLEGQVHAAEVAGAASWVFLRALISRIAA